VGSLNQRLGWRTETTTRYLFSHLKTGKNNTYWHWGNIKEKPVWKFYVALRNTACPNNLNDVTA
jgi:hypothetical protein